MATNLKFEVYDVFNRKEQKMNPIGQAQCKVMELLMSIQQVQRLEIKYDGAVYGFLTVRAWRVREGKREGGREGGVREGGRRKFGEEKEVKGEGGGGGRRR
jgi:hypothetical protein